MKIIRVLKRESPLLIAREVLWRAQRKWNQSRLPRRLARPEYFSFRAVPYYSPDLRSLSQRSRALIVAFAEEIRAGRYPFLGYGTVELGLLPKWNVDFVSNAQWSKGRYEGSEYIRHDGADVKVPFELSRLQFLPLLGKAHVLTREESYRRTAMDLLSHWMQANPVLSGVNWTLAMEAALRAMSICFLLNLLSPFSAQERPWLRSVSRSLTQHLLYIEANLEFSHFITSNHYLSNVVGLYCLSVFLNGPGMAARRLEYRHRIEAEMRKQVYDDGADYEASTGYQVLVTQLFTTALLLMRAEGSAPVAPAFVERLRRMFQFLDALASARGEVPHVGDCDDGRTELLVDDVEQMLLFPVPERNSLRIPHLLGLGQRLFGEGRGDVDGAAWYGLTGAGPVPYPRPSIDGEATAPIKLFPKAGIGVLQRGSAELLFFAIPNGISGKGSHTHNDKLSFVLRVGGKEVLCDSGTGCYTRDIATRNRFRCTAAHNTLQIDGTEQNHIVPGPVGLFMLGNEAAVSPMHAGRDAQGWFLHASHTGYRPLGVTHARTIRVVEGEPAFVIQDKLEGDGLHDFELNFQLAPNRNAEVTPIENGILCRILGDPEVQIFVTGAVPLHGEMRPSLRSTTYGATVPARRVRIWGKATVPASINAQLRWADLVGPNTRQPESATKIKSRDAVAEGVCQA